MNIFRKHQTLLTHLLNLGKDILIPTNIPTKFEVRGVVVGGFKPDSFHATTVDGARMVATPPGFLPLVSSTLLTLLCKKIVCTRTMTT